MLKRSGTVKMINESKQNAWEKTKEKVLEFDRYPKPVQVNFNGKSEHATCPGFCVTIFMMTLMLVFAV
jgi:hypothetical protein